MMFGIPHCCHCARRPANNHIVLPRPNVLLQKWEPVLLASNDRVGHSLKKGRVSALFQLLLEPRGPGKTPMTRPIAVYVNNARFHNFTGAGIILVSFKSLESINAIPTFCWSVYRVTCVGGYSKS